MKKSIRFTDFYTAYNFLADHEMCKYKIKSTNYKVSKFYNCLEIDVVKVNPINSMIENDDNRNTKTEVWLEFGAVLEEDVCEHDTRLDCGGDTFEEAIVELANLVDTYYLDNGKER